MQETLLRVRYGEDADAVAAAREAIRIRAAQAPEHNEIGNSTEHLALVHTLRGDLALAARLEGSAEDLFRRLECERDFTETTSYNRLMELLREG